MAEFNRKLLQERFPQILPYVPEQVLAFGGLPSEKAALATSILTLALCLTSVIGNTVMIILYLR